MDLKRKSQILICCSIISVLVVGIIVGNFVFMICMKKRVSLDAFYGNKINFIFDVISKKYITVIPIVDIVENSISHIVNELDPYSFYISNKTLNKFNENSEGFFCGIGINYSICMDTIVIVNVLQGSPAFKAGLLPGDRVVYVNDSIFSGNYIKKRITKVFDGGVGTLLKLGIFRNSFDKILNFYVKKKNIFISTVKFFYEIEKGIGYIKIYDKFTHSTYNEFMYATRKLLSLGCKSFIIDLRMNKGGSCESAIKIANELLPINNTIVYVEKKLLTPIEYVSDGNGILQNSQIVILIDKKSVSASEIIAGSIQDNDRGLIIGQCSFGKSLIQSQIKISDGSFINITTAQYRTPSGRNIQNKYKLKKMLKQNFLWSFIYNKNKNHYNNNIEKYTTSNFRTLHGRLMYENSGIIPDIFISTNIQYLVPYHRNFESKNIFNQFALNYFYLNHEVLEQFKNYSSMLKYLKTQNIFEKIIRFASDKGINERTFLINYSVNKILDAVDSYIMNFFLKDGIFYPVYLASDFVLAQALEAIHNGYSSPESVFSMKYKNL